MAYMVRVQLTAVVLMAVGVGAVAFCPTSTPTLSDKKLAKDAETWTEILSEKDLQSVVKLYVAELKDKVIRSKGQFNSGYKKAVQAGTVFAILGNAGTIYLKGDEAKAAAALRDVGIELAEAAKAKKFDAAKAAFEKASGYPSKIDPATSADTTAWKSCIKLENLMEVVARIDSDNNKAIKSTADFNKLQKEMVMRAKLLSCLAVVTREEKNEEAWQRFSDDMRAAALELSKQYGSKSQSGAKTSTDALQKSCKECHEKYNIAE